MSYIEISVFEIPKVVHVYVLMSIIFFSFMLFNIGINHGFSCINIRRVPRKVFEREPAGTRRMLMHEKTWLIAILA